jgi:hypothetical protein
MLRVEPAELRAEENMGRSKDLISLDDLRGLGRDFDPTDATGCRMIPVTEISARIDVKTEAPTLPPMDPGLYAALLADIAGRGIVIPLIFCALTGECLDGLVRLAIAKELGIKTIPVVYVGRLSDEERRDIRLVLNGLRRQLSREQLATLIEWTLRKDPGVTDREVGRITGADHKTVASARARLEEVGEIPQHDRRKGRGGGLFRASKPMVFASTTANANEARKAMNALGEAAPEGYSPIRKVRRLARQKQREPN